MARAAGTLTEILYRLITTREEDVTLERQIKMGKNGSCRAAVETVGSRHRQYRHCYKFQVTCSS